jgi:hypothetical protein
LSCYRNTDFTEAYTFCCGWDCILNAAYYTIIARQNSPVAFRLGSTTWVVALTAVTQLCSSINPLFVATSPDFTAQQSLASWRFHIRRDLNHLSTSNKKSLVVCEKGNHQAFHGLHCLLDTVINFLVFIDNKLFVCRKPLHHFQVPYVFASLKGKVQFLRERVQCV